MLELLEVINADTGKQEYINLCHVRRFIPSEDGVYVAEFGDGGTVRVQRQHVQAYLTATRDEPAFLPTDEGFLFGDDNA